MRRRCSKPSRRTVSVRERELEEERVDARPGSSARTSPSSGGARFEAVDGAKIHAYTHPPANKYGALLQMRGGDDDLGRKIAMHIVSMRPRWIGREDVPADDGHARA